MSVRPISAAACAVALIVSGCGNGGAGGGGELQVVATTTQVADLVANVGGEQAEVHSLLKPSSDPHEYEPRPSDARAVAEAALVVRSGGEVDAWLGDLLDNAGGDGALLTLLDEVRARDGDPHWWQDPRNAVLAVRAIQAALTAADPSAAEAYARNAASYIERIEALDAAIAECMDSIPERQRKLVTTHDSYSYFAARYEIEVIGAVIPSLSSQARPSAGDTDALVRQIRREDVAAVFPESSVDPRLERAIAREAGARVGERLFADALGPEGSEGDTYLEALAHDADALARGFTGGRRDCSL